jgi:hypothetical protein
MEVVRLPPWPFGVTTKWGQPNLSKSLALGSGRTTLVGHVLVRPPPDQLVWGGKTHPQAKREKLLEVVSAIVILLFGDG